MADFKIRYLTRRVSKVKNTARYFWQPSTELAQAGWKLERLPDDLNQAMIQAQALNAKVDEWRAGLGGVVTAEKPGSIDALIAAYKSHWRYTKELSPSTKAGYTHNFKIISSWAGDAPVKSITAKAVQALYEGMRDERPALAASVIRTLRLLMQHGIRENWITENPAAKPGLKHKAKKGTIWSPEAVRHFVKTADEMDLFSLGTAVMLNEWIGQRRGDVIDITPAAYRGGCLHICQNKTTADTILPVDLIPALKARLDEQMARNAKFETPPTKLIPMESGQDWQESWFTHQVANVRAIAIQTMPEMEGLIFKDLRHTAVTRLAEVGCPIPQIAAITGHSFRTCQEIVDRYNIRTKQMAVEAFNLRIAAEAARLRPVAANETEFLQDSPAGVTREGKLKC